MRAVIQRVQKADVIVDMKSVGSIKNGLLIFLGVTHDDTIEDVNYLAHKILNLRIFEDNQQKMNLSVMDLNYEILSISQFTLHADTKKGNRPSFIEASRPEHAKHLYDIFNDVLKSKHLNVETGVFGAMMEVSLVNDGPVTIIMDSKQK